MRSRRSILHLGLAAAASLAVSPVSAAFHGTARTGGTITAIDEQARSFTLMRRRRAWTYHTTDQTRYFVGQAPASWSDLKVGAVVHLHWHRAQDQRVADLVRIRKGHARPA
jgi:Cu/Ag efflux protein CusF